MIQEDWNVLMLFLFKMVASIFNEDLNVDFLPSVFDQNMGSTLSAEVFAHTLNLAVKRLVKFYLKKRKTIIFIYLNYFKLF